jgi:uncharacterized membrane protein
VLETATSWCRARGPVARAFGAFLLFLTTSILVFAFPVMPHLASRCVASCLSDTALYAWSFDYMAHVVTAGFDPLHATVVWAPGGVDLAWVTTLTGPALLMTPFTSWIDPIFSVNVLMLLAPALAAWATYLVCVRVTQRFWPSVMGGFVFGFSTYLGQHMRAHLNLVLIFFLPLAVYLVLRRIQRDIAPWVFVLLLGIDIAAQFTVSTELAATTAMFGGVALIGAFAFGGRALRGPIVRTTLLIGLSYVLAALLLAPILVSAFRHPPPDVFRDPTLNSIDVWSLVVPPPTARFGGETFSSLSKTFPSLPQDDTAYVGIALLLVVVLFAIQRRKERATWLLVGFFAFIIVLALGPTIFVGGEPTVSGPQSLIGRLPLIQHALPERYPAYASLTLAVIVALWLAAPRRREPDATAATPARGSSAWRYGLVTLGVVMLSINLSAEPHYHQLFAGPDSVPAFFTEGTYRDYLAPGDTILAVPAELGEELSWQSATDMTIRLARAYVGPVHPSGHEEAGLLEPVSQPNAKVPGDTALTYFLDQRDVDAVVVQEPVAPQWSSLLTATTGAQPVSVDGVSIWRLPPAGALSAG